MSWLSGMLAGAMITTIVRHWPTVQCVVLRRRLRALLDGPFSVESADADTLLERLFWLRSLHQLERERGWKSSWPLRCQAEMIEQRLEIMTAVDQLIASTEA